MAVPELVEEFHTWKNAYIEEHFPKEDWAYLKSISDDSDEQRGPRAAAPAPTAVADKPATGAELDAIYDLLKKDTPAAAAEAGAPEDKPTEG